MKKIDSTAILMGLVFGLVWASAFTSARIIVQYAPPLYALSFRFLVSGIIGVMIARAMGQSWHLTRRQWAAVVVFGVAQNAIYLGLNFVAMQTIEASLAAIVASTMPLLVALASWMIFGEKLRPIGIAGLFAGMIGVSLIMGARLQGEVDLFGLFLCAIAVISLTIATLSMRGASSGGDFLMIVGLQMLVGSVVIIGPAIALETLHVTWTWQLGAAFSYTVVFPGLVATLIWFLLVNRIGATPAAVFHFLTPFFGVSIAAILLGEELGSMDIVGVLIITAGILAVQLSKQKPAP